jgi:tetratricopeptide (TPR) repeat protein
MHSTANRDMRIEQQVRPGNRFTRDMLPWLLTAVALAFYLFTMNRWVSLHNLFQAAKLSGWTWQPNLVEPLYWLVTFPFHWLPVKYIPIGLNLFSLVCAVLTLALLARSVALLPHDRTLEQRQREPGEFALLSIPSAWLPPVMAVMVCGLQLTFWESATAGSGEMLNLLIFAYVIRCLLEFRIDERESWLTRAALVYGLGITNNWAMIGFLPLFIAALVWIRGLSFFNLRFLGLMIAYGLAGLLLYLILPIIQSRADILAVPFWQGFKANLGNQIATLLQLYKSARPTIALLSLTSLVPIFIIAIKWASSFGDTSRIGVALATFTFHVAHAILFLACIWVAADPPFSPRNAGPGFHFLTFYYLGALSVGYFAGYFLLVFGQTPARSRRIPSYIPLMNSTIKVAVWLLFLLVPTVLIARNLPHIRTSNGPLFKRFATLMTETLPSGGAVVLSDDFRRLLLAKSILAQKGQDKNFIFVDSGSFNDHLVLEYPDYHRFLKKQYRERWPVDVPKTHRTFISPLAMIPLFSTLESSNSVFYLHPSFGLYFEKFYLEPHGLAYQCKSYTSTNPFPPSLGQELIAKNEAFWNTNSDAIQGLLASASAARHREKSSLLGRFSAKARLKDEANREGSTVARLYSRALDYWGVELQKAGELEKAATRLEQALELSPDNVAAEVSLQCNKKLQAKQPTTVQLSKSVTELFGPYRSWNNVIGENGPFDEPTFCYEQGVVFVQSQYFRQAMHQFARVKELDPTHLPARLWLAQLYIMAQVPERAVDVIKEVQQNRHLFIINRTNANELLFGEGSAYLANKDRAGAEAAVERTLQQFETDPEVLPKLLATASRMYLNYGAFSNALPLIDRQLAFAPDEMDAEKIGALIRKGYACLQLQMFDKAIPPLNRVLAVTNSAPAMLNRAIAYLRSGQLDSAEKDYQALQNALPKAYPVYFGLAEIAYLRRDTNAAIKYCELYLANPSPNSEEVKLVTQRLAELKPQ